MNKNHFQVIVIITIAATGGLLFDFDTGIISILLNFGFYKSLKLKRSSPMSQMDLKLNYLQIHWPKVCIYLCPIVMMDSRTCRMISGRSILRL